MVVVVVVVVVQVAAVDGGVDVLVLVVTATIGLPSNSSRIVEISHCFHHKPVEHGKLHMRQQRHHPKSLPSFLFEGVAKWKPALALQRLVCGGKGLGPEQWQLGGVRNRCQDRGTRAHETGHPSQHV